MSQGGCGKLLRCPPCSQIRVGVVSAIACLQQSSQSGGWPRLLILRALPTQWVPRSFAFSAKGGRGSAGASGFDRVSTTKSNRTSSIAARPFLPPRSASFSPQRVRSQSTPNGPRICCQLDSQCPRCALAEREHRVFCFTEPELERRMS